MLKFVLFFFFCSLPLVFVSAQIKTKPSTSTGLSTGTASTDKLQVQEFGMKVIKSYFDRDCDFVYNHLANEIRSKESSEVFQKTPQLKAALCAENPLRTDISVDYNLYKNNYQQKVLSHSEFAAQYPQLQAVFALQPGDYFFMGNEPKTASSTRVFRASDMASFVVRKQGGQWQIILM